MIPWSPSQLEGFLRAWDRVREERRQQELNKLARRRMERMISTDEVMQSMRDGLRKWAKERGLTGGDQMQMTRLDAIQRCVRAWGGGDEGGAETLVNCLVALGLLKLEPVSTFEMGQREFDRIMNQSLDAAGVPKTGGALAEAAEALDGTPFGDEEMTRGLASMIILRLIAKGFTITRA